MGEVEHQFESFLESFHPSAKFWSTKILVSLAFLQSLILAVLPPFSHWTESRTNLFYASVLCTECFFLALLHLKAWDRNEGWYGDVTVQDENQLKEPLLKRV